MMRRMRLGRKQALAKLGVRSTKREDDLGGWRRIGNLQYRVVTDEEIRNSRRDVKLKHAGRSGGIASREPARVPLGKHVADDISKPVFGSIVQVDSDGMPAVVERPLGQNDSSRVGDVGPGTSTSNVLTLEAAADVEDGPSRSHTTSAASDFPVHPRAGIQETTSLNVSEAEHAAPAAAPSPAVPAANPNAAGTGTRFHPAMGFDPVDPLLVNLVPPMPARMHVALQP